MASSDRLSPLNRTLRVLRSRGFIVDVCERRTGPVTVDLFGIADIIAAHPDGLGVLLVQATTMPNLASRIDRVREHRNTPVLLASGNVVECWGWRKLKRRGDEWCPCIYRAQLAEESGERLQMIEVSHDGT